MGRDTELITLIKSGSPEGVKKYLSKLKKSGSAKKMATINSQNEEGLSALHLCAMQNQLELLNELLDLKASVNVKDSRGLTPLHYAAFRGNLEVAIALLEFQANACSTANSGETPLHVAAQYGHSNVMSLLVDYQANPLITNNTAQTPLDIACFMGHSKAVRVLLDTGCFPGQQCQTQSLVQSPMHLCAKQGHTEILKMLMEAGFSVDEIGPNGTPLHEAALYGRVDVVKLLIQLGCNQNLKNSQSQTPVDLVHKFTNPRAYTSRQILQALSQARPVAIPRPPSMTQSSGALNLPPSPSHSINSLPDYARIPEVNGGCQETPVRALNLDGMQTEPEPELLMSPVPAYNEYESSVDPSNFASMIAQAAVLRKNTLTSSKRTHTLPQHRHSPSDPVDRLACIKSTKRESFSNSSTDTSFSTASNSGFSTGYLGVSTPDRYQSPSPANLPPHSHLNRPTYLHDYPSNDTYDVPDEYPSALPVSMAMNASLGYDLYDTPSPEAKLVEFHADTTFQGERPNAPQASRPAKQRPADPRRVQTQTESSVVMKKLTPLPAGFNDVSAQAMPLYDNQSLVEEHEASFQPIAMETVPPRPLVKPKLAPKSAAPAEKEHLSELQRKLVLRKIASETGTAPPDSTSHLPPPPPPTSSPPPLSLTQPTAAPMPPRKPPREAQPAPLSPELRAASPEGNSMFLDALMAKKGSLKRAQTLQVLSPPPVSEVPIRPSNPPRPVSGQPEYNSTQTAHTFQPGSSSTLGKLKRHETDITFGTNTSLLPPDSPPYREQRARAGTLLSKVPSTESWQLDRFLTALKLSDYLFPLSEAGYSESADLVGLSADAATEAGVTKAGHKKKFLASIQSLSAKHAGYQHIPTSIETWLSQWNLSSYQDTLIDSGYDDLEFIADMTPEDLQELGIEKRPVLSRFSLALSHLHACIVSHRSIVLSSSPHVTPHKPSITPQQPDKQMECNSNNPTQHTSSVTPRKPSADSTPRTAPHEDTLTPTKWSLQETPPTPPEPTSQLLRKSSAPCVAKKPGIPPPVSKKPPTERRNSKPLSSPDLLPDFPSPPRIPSGTKQFPSPPRIPSGGKEFPSPPSAQSFSEDFPPPPPSVQSSDIFSDFHEDLPPPPPEMSFPLDETPPPPPPDAYTQFQSREEKHNRLSEIPDLDEILSSMSSEGVSSPLHPSHPHPPKISSQRPIESSELLNDIDQMLANLNLEIDSFMMDS